MNPIERLHTFLSDKLNVSPKVADPVIVALVAMLVSFIASGNFDTTELRLAAATAIWGLVGLAAPPAPEVSQKVVQLHSKRERARLR